MALVRNSNWPALGGSLFSDFFDDDRFDIHNSPWLKENEKVYEVELAAPGFNKKDFNISIDNGLLTVSAESRRENEKKEDGYTRREFGYTSFSRSFNLPASINEGGIQAKYEEGILRLSIAKKGPPETKSKKPIEIK